MADKAACGNAYSGLDTVLAKRGLQAERPGVLAVWTLPFRSPCRQGDFVLTQARTHPTSSEHLTRLAPGKHFLISFLIWSALHTHFTL